VAACYNRVPLYDDALAFVTCVAHPEVPRASVGHIAGARVRINVVNNK